jgi:hypothetical protein
MADQVLYSGVARITDLVVKEGLINLDFTDVRAVMREMGHLFVSLPGSTLPSSVRVSQLALALPEGRRVPSGPGSVQPATRLPACSHVDVSGISQVPRRSILCLCLGPRPRPNRRSLAYLSVSSMLPPLRRQRRLQRHGYIGAIAGLQHLLPTLQEWCCHHPCKAHFRLAGSPLPGGS